MALDLLARDFLPDNLQETEDNALYPMVGDLIDWALPPIGDAEQFDLDDLVGQLQLNYASIEAVAAYFNLFIKPVIGSRPAMEFAFRMMSADAEIIEWFQSSTPIPSYKFILQFETYPGNLDFEKLLDIVFALKNERSFPTTIRMNDCPDNFIWDYADWNAHPWDDASGDPTEDGVLICLHQDFRQQIFYAPANPQISSMATGRYGQYLTPDEAFVYDFSYWGDTVEQWWLEPYSTHTTIWSAFFSINVGMNPGSAALTAITQSGIMTSATVSVASNWTTLDDDGLTMSYSIVYMQASAVAQEIQVSPDAGSAQRTPTYAAYDLNVLISDDLSTSDPDFFDTLQDDAGDDLLFD